METFGLILAVFGIIVSLPTIIYSLYNLFDLLADYIDIWDNKRLSKELE